MSGIGDLLKDDTQSFTDNEMGQLGEAANRFIAKQNEIAEAEELLKRLKAEERKIGQEEIPSLMENLGFEKITLKDGRTLMVKEALQCAIPATKKFRAYKWLDDHGHGDLIKIALTSKFGRGEKNEAEHARDVLIELGLSPDLAESVHAGTLKVWAREELAQGRALPAELFKVHVVKLTTIK